MRNTRSSANIAAAIALSSSSPACWICAAGLSDYPITSGQIVDPSETPRLTKKTKVGGGAIGGEVEHGQRKGFHTHKNVGVRRTSMLSFLSPIENLAELQLFNNLLLKHTHGIHVDFESMARDFNGEVERSLRQPQQQGEQGLLLRPKTARELATFDRMLAHEMARRSSEELSECLSGLSSPTSALRTMSMPAQEVLSVLQQLMANAKARAGSQDRMGQTGLGGGGSSLGGEPVSGVGSSEPALTTVQPGVKTYPSKAKPDKPNNQGGGKKTRCGACGKREHEWGGLTLCQHRGVCDEYRKKHPEDRAVKKARKAEGGG